MRFGMLTQIVPSAQLRISDSYMKSWAYGIMNQTPKNG